MYDEYQEYNDQTLISAKNEISKFKADYGGTDLDKPLEFVLGQIKN